MKISIIIPAYNVAPYIKRCLMSLHEQDFSKENYEIIVVNDGSPDNVKGIVEDLQSIIPNLILINQENQGVSAARNNAIKIAKGEYILPIDPDDYILKDSLSKIWIKVKPFYADIVFLDYEKIRDNGEITFKSEFKDISNKIFYDLDTFFKTKGGKNLNSDPDRTWAVLFKKTIVDQIAEPYPCGVPFLEDAVFLAKLFCLSSTLLYIDERFYQRTIRIGSATNSNLVYTSKAKKGFELGVSHILSFKSSFAEKIQSCINGYFINQVLVKFQFLHLKSEWQQGNRLDYQSKLLEYSAQLNGISLKGIREPYKLLGFTIKYMPYLFPVALVWLRVNAYRLILLSKLKLT